VFFVHSFYTLSRSSLASILFSSDQFTMLSSLLVPLALAGQALGAPFLHSARQSGCASGVHIIAARGSTEPQGEGPLQNVSSLIEQSIPGSNDIAVVYPADLVPYESSEEQGVTNMTNMITSYVQQCPTGKIVLLGYSQGGQIVTDVLGGGSYGGTPPLDFATYSKNSEFLSPFPLWLCEC
jgi:Cutinase